jgi:arylsulfatase
MTIMDKPNVLLVVTDHWPGALLGAAGHPAIMTPTLDQLAANGVRFSRAYTECPVCGPARRSIMTGMSPRAHGDREFAFPPLPSPTLAQTFRDNGYQAHAVGKIHVHPQRLRIGFDDVVLDEEGRTHHGIIDDYESFLGENGSAGQQFMHGMSNNEYSFRPWHLSERLHVTNWATHETCRAIRRRDPSRPAFWYVGYRHPHPPLVPLQAYLDLYRDIPVDAPFTGDWARDARQLPYLLRKDQASRPACPDALIPGIRRAFYALCTHIDHQLRTIIGTLREEGVLDNTIIMFTSDHGDMLGNHGLWAKQKFFESSANIPMILCGVAGCKRVRHHRVDDRLVGLQDIMPTLLELAGVPIPKSVTGLSAVGDARRPYLYGENRERVHASRMIHDGRFKLIYYAVGNRMQLFDLHEDPQELRDLGTSKEHKAIREDLTQLLIKELYGADVEWLKDGRLIGLPEMTVEAEVNRGLSNQRGTHWPPPPVTAH